MVSAKKSKQSSSSKKKTSSKHKSVKKHSSKATAKKNSDSSFSKKKKLHKRPLFWTLVFFVLLALALTYLIFVKAKFLLDNEMHIQVSPLDPVLSATNNESPQITFDVEVLKPAFCTASCTFTLEDLSNNNILIQENKSSFSSKSFTYDIPINEYGEGQKMYTYTVKCHNIKQGLCSSDENNFTKAALLTVNFYPTEFELEQKELAYDEITVFIEELSLLHDQLNATLAYKKTLDTVVQSSDLTLATLQDQVVAIQSLFTTLKNEHQAVLAIWQDQRFAQARDELLQVQELLGQAQTISAQTHTSTNYLYTSLQTFTQTLKDVVAQQQTLKRAWYIANLQNDTQTAQAITDLVDGVHADYTQLENNSISGLTAYVERVNAYEQEFIQLINQTNVELNMATQEIEQHTTYYMQLLEEFSLVTPSVTTLSSVLQNTPLVSACSALQTRQDEVVLHNTAAQLYRQNNYPFLEFSAELDVVLQQYFVYTQATMIDPLTPAFVINSTYSSVPTDYPHTLPNGTIITTYDLTTIPQSDLQKMTLIPWNISTQELQTLYCEPVNATPIVINFTYETIPTIDLQLASPLELNTQIPQPQKRCCVFGDCVPCCEEGECEELYPVILVHGHSFYEGNSPELAFTRLANLQEALHDYGYINTGQISQGSQLDGVPNGMWGIMPYPITTRVTYYYTTSQTGSSYELIAKKDDNIETYALRLHDMVELVKERTGKEKVVLVAHSMGGLVTRSYVDIFGENSVEKLIILGTPNYGVEGDVDRLCSLTGGDKECADMSAGSVFLTNLNSPENYLAQTQTYTVTAHGCEMKSNTGKEDGDGVVLARSVPLPFAQNYDINGTCTDLFGTDLHMRFVNPLEFPETLNLVVGFLEE